MAIQYTDGSFSETMLFEELTKRFNREVAEAVGIKALHLGTPLEIEKAKESQKLLERVQELEDKVKGLEPIKTSLVIPTQEDVRKISGSP